MRRLDQALIELSNRGEGVGPDLMLERLERDLAEEPDSTVVTLDLRRTEVQTIEKTTTGESGHRRSRGWLVAAACLAVVGVGAVALGVALTDDDDNAADVTAAPAVSDPAAEQALVGEFVDALQAGDAATARGLVIGSGVGPDFVGWVVALDTTGVTFDCEYSPGSVVCDTTMGPDHFYEQIHGEQVVKAFSATLENGFIVDPVWPIADAEQAAENDFGTWAEDAHPELAATMFDDSITGVVFTESSGEARMQLLDEYLAQR